jgi:excisionase family DNA binding protein
MESQSEWLTTSDVASMLGLGRTRTYELLRSEIPSYRIGRVIRVSRRDLEAWLQTNKTTPKS